METNQVRRIEGNEALIFSTMAPKSHEVLFKMTHDELRKMIYFQQSDEDLLQENLNILEVENTQLREQIEDMERDLDFKDKLISEQEAELRLLRNEREQFVEMGVRMEIQTKELGLIMREQKEQNSSSNVKGKRSPRWNPSTNPDSKSQINSVQFLKNYFAKKFGVNTSGIAKDKKREEGDGGQAAEKKNKRALNLTTVGQLGPSNWGLGALTGRSNDIDIDVNQIELKGSNTERQNKEQIFQEGQNSLRSAKIDEQMYNSVKVDHGKVDNFLGLLDNALDIIQARDSLDVSGTPANKSTVKKLDLTHNSDENEQNLSTIQSIQQGVNELRQSMSSPRSMSNALQKLIIQSEENKAEIDNQRLVIQDLMNEITKKALELTEQKHQVEQTFEQIAKVKLDLATCRTEKIQIEDELEECKHKMFQMERQYNSVSVQKPS